ncbi:MAG: hypothetical protein ACI8RN_002003 [Glaciecola sp.]|jgi:hypothetical protein|uniref:hypothetical protein n=1 Tax=Congregibacter sp. TaxID=2744308 RepID=UPI0039E664F2
MRDDLRIHLSKSSQLRGLIRTLCLLSGLSVFASCYSADFRLLLTAMGFAVLAHSLAQMDPFGITLAGSSIRHPRGEWLCTLHSHALVSHCELRAHGTLASVLWLDCSLEGSVPGDHGLAKSLLVFHDAMSDEQWRLLRRQLRLESRTHSS